MPSERTPARLSVDFTGVSIGGGGRSAHVPEGDYLAQVTAIIEKPVKDDPSRKMLRWTWSLVEPQKFAGKIIYDNTLLENSSLWKLRSLLADLMGGEEKVPAKKLDVPLGTIVSKKMKIGLTLEDHEYNNKLSSQVAATFPKAQWAERQATASSEDIEDDEDEETTKEAATSSDDDEDLEEIDVDDI